jgi:hypothetical protein
MTPCRMVFTDVWKASPVFFCLDYPEDGDRKLLLIVGVYIYKIDTAS